MSTSVLTAAQLALPDHLFHDLLAPMTTCDIFAMMGQSASVDKVMHDMLLERLRDKCATEPTSLASEAVELCGGSETRSLDAIMQTVRFAATRICTATMAERCKAARGKHARNSATLILPAPRDLHGELPRRWPITDATVLAGPGLAHHLICERPRLLSGQQPQSIPSFGLPVDEVMMIRAAIGSPDARVQYTYRSALARAKSRQTRELWMGILNDADGCNPTHAASALAESIVAYILSEMCLRSGGEHSLDPLPHDEICILLGPRVGKFDVDVALHHALESLLGVGTGGGSAPFDAAGASPREELGAPNGVWLQTHDGTNVTRVDMALCAANGASVLQDMMDFSDSPLLHDGGAPALALRLPCESGEAVLAVAALLAVGGVEAQRAAVEQWVVQTPPKEDTNCTFYQVLKSIDMLDATGLQDILMHQLRTHIVNRAAA